MNRRILRSLAAAATAAVGLLGSPDESQAFFFNLFGCGSGCGSWCGGGYTANYAPSCSTCAVPQTSCYSPCQQTCHYVPQTCYRTETYLQPVTTYRAVTTYDPCTGCPQTCCRPCTSYVQQCRQVPYTTYRLTCSSVGCAPCNTCGTSSYAPAAGGYASAGNCSSCAAPYSAPTTTVLPSTPVPSLSPAPATPSSGAPRTYAEPSAPAPAAPQPESRLRPTPDGSTNAAPQTTYPSTTPQSGPQFIDPATRSAQRPSSGYTPVTWAPRLSSTVAPVQTAVQTVVQTQAQVPVRTPAPTQVYRVPAQDGRLDLDGWKPALR